MSMHYIPVLLYATLALGACRDKTEAKSAPAPASKGRGAPVAVTATALFAELAATGESLPSLNGKYNDGVLVSGTVGEITTDLGTTFVQLKAGDKKHVALTFVDQGAVVRAKSVKVDDALTARCELGGVSGLTEVTVGSCVLQ